MSTFNPLTHSVALRRAARGWSQGELAQRAGIPRTSISAIEGERLTPSVTAALALARALECSVEELFGGAAGEAVSSEPQWAWPPGGAAVRFWEAEVGGRRWMYPVEALSLNAVAHDGVWQGGVGRAREALAERTLVLACCDPAAGLLAAEYARVSGFRLIVLPHGSGTALDLLKRGAVHVAGLHYATEEQPDLNTETARTTLGKGYCLVRAARWQEGVVVNATERSRSVDTLLRTRKRWALREPGSAARACLDSVSGRRRLPGRIVETHAAIAQAVRVGWADAGVCIRLTAEEAGLNFVPVRTELLDFCFPAALAREARVLALVRLLRGRPHRQQISELPGYDARDTGEISEL